VGIWKGLVSVDCVHLEVLGKHVLVTPANKSTTTDLLHEFDLTSDSIEQH